MGGEVVSSFTNTFAVKLVAELEDSIQVKKRVIDEQVPILNEILQVLIQALQEGKKIILFGNGGSAADSQHIAAELVSKFRRDRRALPAIALTTDTSILTSIGNDYSFADVFARQIEALGQEGDVAIGISTSGNSPNVLKGIGIAREQGLIAIGFTGADGGKLKECVDICFRAPSQTTARIQEAHITVAHALCEIIEQEFCQDDAQSRRVFRSGWND
jgi:D-sedoheptulose 7-phosphate isomerase